MESALVRAAKNFPAVVLTGPRRAGKTELLRHLFPKARYYLLEDPDVLARVRTDPRAFVEELQPPVLIDEIQNAPEVIPYLRTRIDAAPRKTGNWLLTGSQEFALMRGVTETLAGRAAVLRLLPLSLRETPKATPFAGGFPEVLARPGARDLWFASYVQTYLEHDVRSIAQIRDLTTYRRFMALLASRNGQMVNRADLASALGVSSPTIAQWLDILETTALVSLVPPYFENFGKRLVKTPKVYWHDSGLLCHLLGIRSVAELNRSPFLGAIWEGFVGTEIIKAQINAGRGREIYYFRDSQGLEVDFLVPGADGLLNLVEVKASKTLLPRMAAPMNSLASVLKKHETRLFVVGKDCKEDVVSLSNDVKGLTVLKLLKELEK
jgi:predicted AAA+ superfamily ATPase